MRPQGAARSTAIGVGLAVMAHHLWPAFRCSYVHSLEVTYVLMRFSDARLLLSKDSLFLDVGNRATVLVQQLLKFDPSKQQQLSDWYSVQNVPSLNTRIGNGAKRTPFEEKLD
jgi:hypothetical protein